MLTIHTRSSRSIEAESASPPLPHYCYRYSEESECCPVEMVIAPTQDWRVPKFPPPNSQEFPCVCPPAPFPVGRPSPEKTLDEEFC